MGPERLFRQQRSQIEPAATGMNMDAFPRSWCKQRLERRHFGGAGDLVQFEHGAFGAQLRHKGQQRRYADTATNHHVLLGLAMQRKQVVGHGRFDHVAGPKNVVNMPRSAARVL
jgi:hypothetical protein